MSSWDISLGGMIKRGVVAVAVLACCFVARGGNLPCKTDDCNQTDRCKTCDGKSNNDTAPAANTSEPGGSAETAGSSTISNSSLNVSINFGAPANENIGISPFFSIYSSEPSPALYTPQMLQYNNLFLDQISQIIVNLDYKDQILGPNYEINDDDSSIEGGTGRVGLSGILGSNITHQVKIFTTQREIITFQFNTNQSQAKPIGKKAILNYRLDMVSGAGDPVTTVPVYYDLSFGNGVKVRYRASDLRVDSIITVSGRVISATSEQVGLEAIYDDDDILRQVWSAADGLADIVVTSPMISYEIRLYTPDQTGAKVNGLYTISGSSHTVFKIENPNPPIGSSQYVSPVANSLNTNAVRVTKTVGGVDEVSLFEYGFGTGGWILRKPGDLIVSKSIAWDTAHTTKTIVQEKKSAAGGTSSASVYTYGNYSYGDRITSSVDDPDGAALKTEWSYTSDGRISSVKYPEGNWYKYGYDNNGRTTSIISAWKNSPLNSSASNASSMLFSYSRIDPRDIVNANDDRPRRVDLSVLGRVVNRSYYAYYFDNNAYVEVEEQATSPSASYGDNDSLRTEKRYYPGGSDLSPSAGRLHKVINPNGTIETWSYEYGVWAPSASDSNPGVFTPGNGGAVRATIIYGTVANPDGIANKTTRRQIVWDARGCEVLNIDGIYDGSIYEEVGWVKRSYDGLRRKISEQKSNGELSQYSWNCCALEWEKLSDGTEYTYTYDATKRLIAKTLIGSTGGTGDITTTYTYDAADRKTSETITGDNLSTSAVWEYDLAGQLIRHTDHRGGVTTYSYSYGEGYGVQITANLPGGGKSVTTNFFDGKIASVTGDAQLNLFYDYGVNQDGSIWTKVNYAQNNSPRWQKTTIGTSGNILSVEKSGYNEALIAETYTYNGNNQLIKIAKFGQADILISYDELGNIAQMGMDVNANGTLDPASNDMIFKIDIGYAKINNIWYQQQVESTYPIANSSTEKVIKTTRNKLNTFANNQYFERQIIDVNGNITTETLNKDSRNSKVIMLNIKYPHSTVSETTTINNGLITSYRNTFNNTTTMTYDSLRRQITETQQKIGTSTLTYHNAAGKRGLIATLTDPRGGVTSFDYDAAGRMTSRQNALEKSSYIAYNTRGQAIRVWGETEYPISLTYDEYGQPITMSTYRNTTTNFGGATFPTITGDTTTWAYDASSGLLKSKTDAAGKSVNYTYTADGKLATRTWARLNSGTPLVTTYSYSPFTGKQTGITYSDNTPSISYTYNRLGDLAEVSDAAGTREFTYNSALQLLSESISGVYDKTLTRNYESSGVVGRYAGLDGNTTLTYSNMGLINAVNDINFSRVANIDFLHQVTRPNNVNTTWTYENHLTRSVSHTSGSTFTYTYDLLGRRIRMQRSGVTPADVRDISYTYNDRNELTGVTSDSEAYTYQFNYDPIGNRLDAMLGKELISNVWQGNTIGYTSNSLNQYSQIDSNPITYDFDGNMLTRDGWSYSWNGENRLVKAEKGNQKLEFDYDYMGRRIFKKVYESNTLVSHLKFVYDGYKLIEELDGLDDDAVLRGYTWQPNGVGLDTPLTMTVGNDTYYYLTDTNKNITELTNANGQVVAYYEYDPYGKITTATGAMAEINPFRFSSEYHDDETSLVYYNYRYYSPELGRWLSRDPIAEQGGSNLYNFLENDSINLWDDLGLLRAADAYNILSRPGRLRNNIEDVINGVPPDPCGSQRKSFSDRVKSFFGITTVKKYLELLSNDPDNPTFWDWYNAIMLTYNPAKGLFEAYHGMSFGADDLGRQLSPGERWLRGTLSAVESALTALSIQQIGKAVINGVKSSITESARNSASTGRTTPLTLQEQLTMSEAKSGAGKPLSNMTLGDPRFSGMQKMEHSRVLYDGQKATIHYIKDPVTGKTYDFKFK